jgi:VWA domain-containing protein
VIVKTVKLGALILCLTSCLSAQEAPCTTRTLLVNVLDEKGKPAEVSTDSFRAKYRGHSVDILSATSIATSPRIVLLLDASGSISSGRQWKADQLLAADLIRASHSSSSFALVVFGSQIQIRVGFAEGLAAVTRKFDELPSEPRGPTAIYDAIFAALDELRPPREGDTIYVITDGEDNKSSHTPSQVEPRLLNAGVRVFAFLLVGSVPFRVRVPAESGPRNLADLAQQTGGTTSSFEYVDYPPHQLSDRDLATIVASARLLYPLMQHAYRLKIAMPPGIEKPRDWTLEVMEGKKKSHLQVLYPRLAPCAAETPSK